MTRADRPVESIATMRTMRNLISPVALAGLIATGAVAAPRTAWAQEDPELRAEVLRVEQGVLRMLKKAVDATVLVRATVPGGGFGSGSGVIITESGEILTCAHVVDAPGAILSVRMSDGRVFPAKLVGRHSVHDYALLKIASATGRLPIAPMGRSAKIARGDWVVAMGHPLRPNRDNQPTVSVGRVRLLHQQLAADMNRRRYPDVIMHDAPLFSGNSGGPLFDLQGRVVGINAAITILNDNGYSVPIDRVRKDLEELRAGKSLGPDLPGPRRPTIDRSGRGGGLPGLTTEPVPAEVAGHFGLNPNTGEWVRAIRPRSAAARSPLRVRDIILELNGKPLASDALHDRLEEMRPGSTVKVKVLRGNLQDGWRRVDLEVKLGRARP